MRAIQVLGLAVLGLAGCAPEGEAAASADGAKADEVERPFADWSRHLEPEQCGVTNLVLMEGRTYLQTQTYCDCHDGECTETIEGRYRFAGRRVGGTVHRYIVLYNGQQRWLTYEYRFDGGDTLELAYAPASEGAWWTMGQGAPSPSTQQMVLDARVRTVLAEHRLESLPFVIDAAEVARQEALGGQVGFEAALSSALTSFLSDGEHPESPVGLVINIDEPGMWDQTPCPGVMDHVNRARCFVSQPDSRLSMLEVGDAGEGDEPVDATRWTFSLYIGSLSDHGHWATVSRDASFPTYNWGFN